MTCDKVIEKGTPRLSEEAHDIGIPTLIQRHYHLRCALATSPDVLRRGLADVRGDVVIADRAQLETKLAERAAAEVASHARRHEAQLAAEREATKPRAALDPVTFQLTEQLLDHPEDPGALGVLADQLLTQNELRGELIVVQLALAALGSRAELFDEDEADDEDDGVGGNQADNSALNSGAVYVFTRTGPAWSQQAYLKASNTDAGDFFGDPVAVSGDTLAVGADLEDSSAAGVGGDQANNAALDSGAVYVFR
ncbi:MAG: FG-GAP repeat protein [Deltaproteobacteria bacterium]|nr:FG-GAP repeat protein [Deltaproteobacteria bacterium]